MSQSERDPHTLDCFQEEKVVSHRNHMGKLRNIPIRSLDLISVCSAIYVMRITHLVYRILAIVALGTIDSLLDHRVVLVAVRGS